MTHPTDPCLFPPVLQLLALAVLGIYVILSILGRVLPFMKGIWRDPHLIDDRSHVTRYTLIPLLIFAGLAIAISARWDPSVPWHGGWPLEELLPGPGMLAASLLLVVAGNILAGRIDTSNARRVTSWIPIILVLSGIGLLIMGLIRLMSLL